MTSAALKTGDRFADRFEIVSTLASGRRGETYVARDEQSGRDVAVLHVALMLSERQKRALEQTRFVLHGAQHHGLAPSIALGVTAERPWFATQLLYGVSLEQALRSDGVIPMRRAAALVSQVAKALSVPHEQRLWHRSLKPSNLFLVGGPASDTIVVLDLGVGAVLCSDGRSIATPQLGAPEESVDASVDGRSDIYTLGGVLFEMLTGHPPFDGDSEAELRAAHRLQAPPKLRALKPSAQPLEQIVNKMLEKRPDDRFQTMADVSQALDEVLAAPVASLEVDASDPAPEPPVTSDTAPLRTWALAAPDVAPTARPAINQPASRPTNPARPKSGFPWWVLAVAVVVAFVVGWWAGR